MSTVFMECADKLLLLQRATSSISPGSWGVPGGKLEGTETPLEGLLREIREELMLEPDPKELNYATSVYVSHPLAKYKLHLFKWPLRKIPEIQINTKEHQAFIWREIGKLKDLNLLEGQLEAYYYAYGMLPKAS